MTKFITVPWESPNGTKYALELSVTGPRDDPQIQDIDCDPVLARHDLESLDLYLDSGECFENIDENWEG